MTAYQVAIRHIGVHTTGPWHYTTINQTLIHYVFKGLVRGNRYQVAVRAINPLGRSGWLVQTTQTLR